MYPTRQHLLNFLIGGELTTISLRKSSPDFFELPIGQ